MTKVEYGEPGGRVWAQVTDGSLTSLVVDSSLLHRDHFDTVTQLLTDCVSRVFDEYRDTVLTMARQNRRNADLWQEVDEFLERHRTAWTPKAVAADAPLRYEALDGEVTALAERGRIVGFELSTWLLDPPQGRRLESGVMAAANRAVTSQWDAEPLPNDPPGVTREELAELVARIRRHRPGTP